MHKHLIINADDFGMSREVNEGTKIGINKGVITSVSVMANMPYFTDAISYLKKHKEISVGLHFNITEGKPIIHPHDATNLIREDDHFYFWTNMIPRVSVRSIKLKEIEKELIAQYEKLAATGLPITHIDSHHHIHLYPRIFKLVNKFAEEKKVKALRGDSFSFWNLSLGVMHKPIPTQAIVNAMLLYSHLRFPRRKHFTKINGFYDINWGKDLTVEDLLQICHKLPQGTTELICHLAVESTKGNKKFLSPRFKALKLLTHPQIVKALRKNGIDLTRHG